MKLDVAGVRLDPLHGAGGDAQELAAVAHPEMMFLDVRGRLAKLLQIRAKILKALGRIAGDERSARAIDHYLEPRQSHRLANEVDRPGIEGLQRELRVSGDEGDQWRARSFAGGLPGQRFDDVETVHLRHLDVKNEKIRLEALDRRGRVAGVVEWSDDFHIADLLQHSAQASEREL